MIYNVNKRKIFFEQELQRQEGEKGKNSAGPCISIELLQVYCTVAQVNDWGGRRGERERVKRE